MNQINSIGKSKGKGEIPEKGNLCGQESKRELHRRQKTWVPASPVANELWDFP